MVVLRGSRSIVALVVAVVVAFVVALVVACVLVLVAVVGTVGELAAMVLVVIVVVWTHWHVGAFSVQPTGHVGMTFLVVVGACLITAGTVIVAVGAWVDASVLGSVTSVRTLLVVSVHHRDQRAQAHGDTDMPHKHIRTYMGRM